MRERAFVEELGGGVNADFLGREDQLAVAGGHLRWQARSR